jgi:hypothetical protein
MECANCFVTFTPQWRKLNGNIYCNSCACCYNRWKKFTPHEQIYAKILVGMSKS